MLLNAIFPTATIELQWGKRYYMPFTPATICRKSAPLCRRTYIILMCTRATPCGVVETMSKAPHNAATYYSSAV
ncbi:hypothetical protein [Alloprevotella tannerae]|uniref:hypothetical protein n=1 Tax=Alloprevotella tannerae TaxID=76122 RepID=UPI0028D24595|nr:hypothetical protein [Alloprevotella tannerae]